MKWMFFPRHQELTAYYGDGGAKAREALEKIEDPSLKAFLELEFEMKNRKSK